MKYCIFSLIFLTSIIPLVLFVHAQEDIKELSKQNEVLRYEISQTEKEIRLLKTDMQILIEIPEGFELTKTDTLELSIGGKYTRNE